MKTKLAKLTWIAAVCLGFLLIFAAFLSLQPSTAKKSLDETRQALRAQGFKTDLADFNLATSGDTRTRSDLIAHTGLPQPPASQISSTDISLLVPAGTDSAIPIWKQELLSLNDDNADTVTWQDLQDYLDPGTDALDASADAILSGPIQFDLNANDGSAMRLPHLATMRQLGLAYSYRLLVDLRSGNNSRAWTNLLAVTRLTTAWKPEPAEISHRIHYVLAGIAFDATWQALQHKAWTPDQLATLQKEWESADFFQGLPETAAFHRASIVALCQQSRDPTAMSGPTWPALAREITRSPSSGFQIAKGQWRQARYRVYGTYIDEKNLLLFYRDREIETRNAIKATNWIQMQTLPGITNSPIFLSPFPSRFQALLNLQELRRNYDKLSGGIFTVAAVAETRRRLLVTALALARYHLRHGAYPDQLSALVPEFLPAVPIDFMDGNPLRYRLTGDGQFVAYSVGLDGTDDGGTLKLTPAGRFPFKIDQNVLWPRAAADSEIATYNQQAMDQRRQLADDRETQLSDAQWKKSDRRQADIDKLLATPPNPLNHLPDFNGHPLADLLHNTDSTGTNQLSLLQMLTLKQVITGDEPETITFQAPISYAALTNIGQLTLCIDTVADPDSEESSEAEQVTCESATNGDCLLHWSTIYESPGRHALQMVIFSDDPRLRNVDLSGPASPFDITNLCQFSLASAQYDPAIGSFLHARLPEPEATYTIECNQPDGTRIKTLTGATTNGEIKILWDLLDDHGQRFTNDDFNTVFHLKLTASGRTQTLRGP